MTGVNKISLWYCRAITAVAIMYYVIKNLGLCEAVGAAVVYALYFLLSLFVAKEIPFLKSQKRQFSMAFCLLCLSIMLVSTIVLSYIFPASSQRVELSFLYVLSSVVLSPILEELFFRWALINLERPILFAIFSSVIFGLFHSAESFFPALLLGGLLSLFYVASGNIFVPIICHMGNNALALICSLVGDVRVLILIVFVIVFVLVLKFGDKSSDEKAKKEIL